MLRLSTPRAMSDGWKRVLLVTEGALALLAIGCAEPVAPFWGPTHAQELQRVDTPYFTLQVPAGLLVSESGGGRHVSIAASARQALAVFDVSVTPLSDLNGYPAAWDDLRSYFLFVGRPVRVVTVAGATWGDLSDPMDDWVMRTLFRLHEGRFVQVSYHFPSADADDYADMFAAVLRSVMLKPVNAEAR